MLLTEGGKDLSNVATADKLNQLIERLDKTKARQVVKAKTDVINALFEQAKTTANHELAEIGQIASQNFGEYLDKEIGRLTRLQAVNPNVRDDEIAALQKMKDTGLSALTQLSLVSDCIRILVCVKPS